MIAPPRGVGRPPLYSYPRPPKKPRKPHVANNKKDWSEMIAFYRDGHNIPECSERFGISKQRVHQVLVANSANEGHRAYRQGVDIDEVIALYAEGHAIYEIAGRCGKTDHSVRKILEDAGVARPPHIHPREAEIVEYYRAGHTPKECFERFGFHVRCLLVRNHLPMIPVGQKWTRRARAAYIIRHTSP